MIQPIIKPTTPKPPGGIHLPPHGGHALPPGSGAPKAKGAGAGATDPATGLPKMQSAAEIRAAANAQAWKTIQQQQAALPSEGAIIARYGAQSAAIQPLVNAHRAWLENAGQYSVGVNNALSQIVGTQNTNTDTAQAGSAALGGAPMGSAPATNVSPGAGSTVVTAPGGAFANYLHSLVPFADQLGASALAKINQNQTTDMQSLDAAKKQIALGLPALQQTNYNSLTSTALNQYKGELAALVAGGKNTVAGAKLAETTRHDLAGEALGLQNSATAQKRAADAFKLGMDRLNKTTVKGATRTSAENSKLQTALGTALKNYGKTGGQKGYTQWAQTVTFNPPKIKYGDSPPKKSTVVYGATPEEVKAKVQAFLAANNKPSKDPTTPNGVWSAAKAPSGVGNKSVTGRTGDYTRRMEAWRYFAGTNAASAHPLTTSALQVIFRKAFGAPK